MSKSVLLCILCLSLSACTSLYYHYDTGVMGTLTVSPDPIQTYGMRVSISSLVNMSIDDTPVCLGRMSIDLAGGQTAFIDLENSHFIDTRTNQSYRVIAADTRYNRKHISQPLRQINQRNRSLDLIIWNYHLPELSESVRISTKKKKSKVAKHEFDESARKQAVVAYVDFQNRVKRLNQRVVGILKLQMLNNQRVAFPVDIEFRIDGRMAIPIEDLDFLKSKEIRE